MWRGWGSIGALGGEGGVVKTFVRHMSRKRGENLRKINPRVSYPEATSIAQDLFNLFKQHGPLTYSATWTSAQEARISGIDSKTHMKLLLKWMRGKNIVTQVCQHVGSNKKFLLCTPDDPLATEPQEKTTPKKSTKAKQTKKSSKKGKK